MSKKHNEEMDAKHVRDVVMNFIIGVTPPQSHLIVSHLFRVNREFYQCSLNFFPSLPPSLPPSLSLPLSSSLFLSLQLEETRQLVC